MKDLTKKQQEIIEIAIRGRFDENTCGEEECKLIIDAALKLEMDNDFIMDLIHDFSIHFSYYTGPEPAIEKSVGELIRDDIRRDAAQRTIYFEEFEVIDGLNQHPSGLNFEDWQASREV